LGLEQQEKERESFKISLYVYNEIMGVILSGAGMGRVPGSRGQDASYLTNSRN
jgi:hypothetical protein